MKHISGNGGAFDLLGEWFLERRDAVIQTVLDEWLGEGGWAMTRLAGRLFERTQTDGTVVTTTVVLDGTPLLEFTVWQDLGADRPALLFRWRRLY